MCFLFLWLLLCIRACAADVCHGEVEWHPLAPLALNHTHVQVRVESIQAFFCVYEGLSHTVAHEFQRIVVDDALTYVGPSPAFVDTIRAHARPTVLFGLVNAFWRMPPFEAMNELRDALYHRAEGGVPWKGGRASWWTDAERFCAWRDALERALDTWSQGFGVSESVLPFGWNLPCRACARGNQDFVAWLCAAHQRMQERMSDWRDDMRDVDAHLQKAHATLERTTRGIVRDLDDPLEVRNWAVLLDVAARHLVEVQQRWIAEKRRIRAEMRAAEFEQWPQDEADMLRFLAQSTQARVWRDDWTRVCEAWPRDGLGKRDVA